MSTIDLDATVTLERLVIALAGKGATLIWGGDPLPLTTRIELEVETDAQDAYDALPSYFLDDDDDDNRPSLNVDAVCAVLDACLAGDRALAITLLSRLAGDPGEHDRI